MWRSGWSESAVEISTAGARRRPQASAASRASSIPSALSWSVSASSSTAAAEADSTTSRGGSSPSEWSEWLWRSNVGGASLIGRGRVPVRGFVSLTPPAAYMESMKTFLLAALAALALPGAAIARSNTVAPAGNSAVSQYVENVPTAKGSRPANTIHVGGGGGGGGGGSGIGGSSGSGGGTGGGGGSSALSANTQQALSRQGGDGLAAAALARATAPATLVVTTKVHGTPATAGSSTPQPAGSTGSSSGSGSSSSVVGTLVNALTGGSSQGGLGPVLPVLLVICAVGAVALGFRRRRHPGA